MENIKMDKLDMNYLGKIPMGFGYLQISKGEHIKTLFVMSRWRRVLEVIGVITLGILISLIL